MYCYYYEFSVYFLKFLLRFLFLFLWSHNLEFSKQNAIWHRVISDYDFDIYFFKMFAIQFSDKFSLKILLKLSQKIFTLVACQVFFLNDPNSFSETRVLE